MGSCPNNFQNQNISATFFKNGLQLDGPREQGESLKKILFSGFFFKDFPFKILGELNLGCRPRRKAKAGPRRETVRCGATFNPLELSYRNLLINDTKK